MQETTESAGRGRTVVVVEDNVRSRRLVRDLLELNGFDPVEAESAEEGLAAVRSCRPALLLLDIQLPGMDGEVALRELKADPETAGIPVVAVTAYAMRGDEERLLAAGFDGYIAKPIDTRSFVPRLQEILDAAGG
jgi:CheY-like chemotaxis protein